MNKFRDLQRIAEKTRADDSETATLAVKIFTGILNQKRSRKDRPNPLNDIIRQYLLSHRNATTKDVLNHLIAIKGEGVVDDVEDNEIWYVDQHGRSKRAKVSGLKDRVSDLKKKICSE